jgi:peptidoglycan/LPS O-acetylase OafA/YrhL
MGIVCGTHIDQLQSWLQAHRRLLLAALAAAAALCLAESELVYQTTVDHWRLGVYSLGLHVYAVAAIMGFLACRDASLAGRKWLAHFGTRSYGIYLLQGPIIEATARVLYHVAPWVLGVQALFQPILFSVALAVPLAFMTAVSRSRLRSFYRYLFG